MNINKNEFINFLTLTISFVGVFGSLEKIMRIWYLKRK